MLVLVDLSALARVVAAFEAAPELSLARPLDGLVHSQDELVAARGDDRVVQGKVPHLELLGALRGGASFEAAAHLLEVAVGRPGDDEREHLGLEKAARRHHVGRADVVGVDAVAPFPARSPGTGLAQERPASDLARYATLGLEDRERVAHHRSRHAQLDGERALGREPPAGLRRRARGRRQDQVRELVAVGAGRGGVGSGGRHRHVPTNDTNLLGPIACHVAGPRAS